LQSGLAATRASNRSGERGEIIRRSGENVAAGEVEEMLLTNPEIRLVP
jgi:non-ribosomal peptide synthetase component E (peptide arylation enzyme)